MCFLEKPLILLTLSLDNIKMSVGEVKKLRMQISTSLVSLASVFDSSVGPRHKKIYFWIFFRFFSSPLP